MYVIFLYTFHGDIIHSLRIVSTKEFTQIETSTDKPLKRQGCSLNYYDNNVYLYGGIHDNLYYDDLWKYCIKQNKWILLKNNFGVAFHRTAIYKNYIILFGGEMNITKNWELQCSNDIIIYNVNTNTWSTIETSNKPIPRYDIIATAK